MGPSLPLNLFDLQLAPLVEEKEAPSLSTSRSARPVDRMIGDQRLTVQINVRAKSAPLHKPFRQIVALLAQALKRAEPEFVDAATVRFDVITDFSRHYGAALLAELAQRMSEQCCFLICAQRPVEYHRFHFVGRPRTPWAERMCQAPACRYEYIIFRRCSC